MTVTGTSVTVIYATVIKCISIFDMKVFSQWCILHLLNGNTKYCVILFCHFVMWISYQKWSQKMNVLCVGSFENKQMVKLNFKERQKTMFNNLRDLPKMQNLCRLFQELCNWLEYSQVPIQRPEPWWVLAKLFCLLNRAKPAEIEEFKTWRFRSEVFFGAHLIVSYYY